MTAANFEQCLKWVLESEGGDDDDPQDHGGRTSRGIVQYEYNAYRRNENLPEGDVWHATDAEVKQIYYISYWLPYCNDFPTAIDYMFFDMQILSGLHAATKVLQRALDVGVDGHIGIITRNALTVSAYTDRPKLLDRITQKRITFFRSLRQPRFVRGWINRAHIVNTRSLGLYKGTITT